jgi:hypothetical protein
MAGRFGAALRDLRTRSSTGTGGRRTGWSSVRDAAAQRAGLGWIALTVGAGLCLLGWYGVSGERYTAQQVPYLASATAPGAALIIGGMVLLAARRQDQEATSDQERTLHQLELLYRLLTEEAAMLPEAVQSSTAVPPASAASVAGAITAAAVTPLLAVPGGGTYHRGDCLLVQGRQDPEPVSRASLANRGLRPCPLCDPPVREG